MRRALYTIAILGATTAAASAAEPGTACAPILSAMKRTLEVDHATLTERDGQTMNGITAAGVNYLQIGGVWNVSPISPRDNQQRSDENLRNANAYLCQSLPDSIIDGAAVANYQTRTETEDAVVESKIAISKLSGLAVEVVNDMTAAGSSKSHYRTRYTFTGIHAPSVQK
jgi:hypothetical protein